MTGKNWLNALTASIIVALLIFIVWLSWTIGRRITYRLAYEDQVQRTIKDRVKSDALKLQE